LDQQNFHWSGVYGRRWKCWQWLQGICVAIHKPPAVAPEKWSQVNFPLPRARRNAHFRHDSRMLVKMLDGAGDGLTSRAHNDAFDPSRTQHRRIRG